MIPVLGALNHVLAQSPWASARLRPHAGRRARFELAPWSVAFAITADGLVDGVANEGEPFDVTIRLPADTPALALQGMDKAMGAAQVEGNAEFATELSFVLKNLRWDAEEDLSRVFGDAAAHRLALGMTAFARWHRDAARNLAENLAEYFADERAYLVRPRDLAAMKADVADLAGRLDRLESRVEKIR